MAAKSSTTSAPATSVKMTTRATAPDAPLFEMIERCAMAWRESTRFDEAWAKLKRAGGDSAKIEQLFERSKQLGSEAIDLEWKIREAEVFTPQGLAAKISAIRRAEFNDGDMPAILELLERDAERIGAGKRRKPDAEQHAAR